MRIHRNIQFGHQLNDTVNMVKMPVGENDRRGRVILAIALLGYFNYLIARPGHTGIHQHPLV